MKKVIAVIVVLLLGVLAFVYWGTKSEGYRAGVIIKVSKKGVLFKTYEGQMNMNTFGSIKGKSAMNESFEFSIPKDSVLLGKIEDLTGKPVKLYYKQKYFLFPWRGETTYLATDIKLNEEGMEDNEFPR